MCRFTDWGPNTPADTERFLVDAAAQSGESPRQGFSLAVVRRDDGRLIGSCAVWRDSAPHARGSLGFVFAPDVWRQGYATEVTGLLLDLGFRQLDLAWVEATCRPANVGSARALARAGMQTEGLLRGHVVVRGDRQDSLLFARLRDG